MRDIRYAVRCLLRTPAATAIAVLALALGIGVNASSFISTSALILHPLPYPRLDRIVTLWETLPKIRADRTPLAPADFADLQRETHSFEQVAAYREWDAALTGMGDAQRVEAALVTPAFFRVLGKTAALGRTFGDADGEAPPARAAVVSYGFWKTQLAGAPDAIGKPLLLDGKRYTVIGVMPREFNYPLQNEIWAPLILDASEEHQRATRDLLALALLKPNTTAAEAGAEMAALASRLGQRYPSTNEGRSMEVSLLRESSDEVTKHFLLTLTGATLFVLLLACANVGNLQLARAANRQKEIAVRAALGASRFQIGKQIVIESVLISLPAGGLGLLLASWGLDLRKPDIPAAALRIEPGLADMHIDSTVVILTIAVSIAAGLLCSLPAMFQLAVRRMRMDLREALQERGGSQGAIPSQNRLRSALVVFELAMALVLLVGAGLMVNTFQRLLERYQGFDPKNVLTMQVSLPATVYQQPAQVTAFVDRALHGTAAISGVEATAVSSAMGPAERFVIEGQPEPRPSEPRPEVTAASSQYLAAMRIGLLNGRFLSERDRADKPGVVVISKAVARHYWPHGNPIGQHIRLNGEPGWLTVVGVCGDVVNDWFTGQPTPAAYVPYTQTPRRSTQFVIRTARDPLRAAPAVRREISRIDKNLPVYYVETLEKEQADERGGVHAAATTMTDYAVIALLLAATGIYGVLSYFVAARTHDIGVHMALGATRLDVLKMTMRKAAVLTGVGLFVGIPLAVMLARVMSSALYGVVRVEPLTFAVFTGILAFSALLASYLPSRRATHIEPMAALRNE